MNIDGTLGNKYQGPTRVRPFDFGTDAIERQRVCLGQSLIDADFEYGLQATKWQTHMDTRKFLSYNEIPGSDVPFTSIASDATGRVITVSLTTGTQASIGPVAGQLISVQGLSNIASNAQGTFQVFSNVVGMGSLTYLPIGIVPASTTFNVPGTTVRRSTYINSANGLTNSFLSLNVASISMNVTSASNTMNISFTSAYHGILPGMTIYISNVFAPAVTYGVGISSNTVLQNGNCAGYFVVNSVPNFSNITSNFGNYPGVNVTNLGLTVGQAKTFPINSSNAGIYVNSQGYALHRPYDGGVLITTNNPAFGSTFVRQSKKVFRYQSGKGLLWSSGTLFCPNNDISSISANGLFPGTSNNITIQCAVPHGSPQVGAFIQVKGVTTSGYNGNYQINGIIDNLTLNVAVVNTLGSITPILDEQPRFIVTRWQGASIRVGPFDEQNGLFWEFDGQTLWVVRRTSTLQISGLVSATPGNNLFTGVATRFQDQFKINDKFTLKGMTYTVIATPSQTQMYCNPAYRGTVVITNSTACKIKDIRIPQNQFNRDTIDGTGPSGFKFDATKMQMVGIQYTWYGAGFVDFMMRGTDGNWVYAHRMRQNNINDEAYMRSGNLPVRYELTNETSHATSKISRDLPQVDTNVIAMSEQLTYWPPSGVVMIDNEMIAYASKTSNTLVGLSRSNAITYVINNMQQLLTAGPQVAHLAGNTAFLFNTTCSPSLTHWGSALLMDGQFDQDRGYLFNYQLNNFSASISAGVSRNLFMIRLSPSVSNGVVGDLGQRELINKAQILLSRLDVWVQAGSTAGIGNAVFSGILNPHFKTYQSFNTLNWVPINSPLGLSASQPSFAQVVDLSTLSTPAYLEGSGEKVFSTICNAGSQYSIDLNDLKEISCNAVGGNNSFPDGPDTLLIQISCPTGSSPITQYSLNLFWSEAQA